MRSFKIFLIGFVLIAMLAVGVGSVTVTRAQDDNTISCDSDLTLLWYIAERYFSFGAVQNSLAQTGAPVVDMNRFNRGQFTPLFDALHNAQDPTTFTLPGVALSLDWMNTVMTTMSMDETSFQGFLNSMQMADPSTMTPLSSAGVAGEAPECTQLRSQIQHFFAAVSVQDLQAGFTSGSGVNGNMDANVGGNGNTSDNTGTGSSDANMTTTPDASGGTSGNDSSGTGSGDANMTTTPDGSNSGDASMTTTPDGSNSGGSGG